LGSAPPKKGALNHLFPGSGIDEEHISSIWKPFFTTKEPTKGTGLGLSISKRIIESHGGEIRYDSESAFTKFIISLPKAQKHLGLNKHAGQALKETG